MLVVWSSFIHLTNLTDITYSLTLPSYLLSALVNQMPTWDSLTHLLTHSLIFLLYQQELARILYWGARGVARNTDEAVNYYRMAAKGDNPAALYNYGIVLMKVCHQELRCFLFRTDQLW